MKGTAVCLIALLFSVVLIAGCVSTPTGTIPGTPVPVTQEGRPQYIIGVDGDYPPFTYRDAGGNFTGFDIEAARWIAVRKGFDPVFSAIPWDGMIPALNEGKVDMIYSGMTVTPGRQAQVDFTIPYYSVNLSIAARSGSSNTMNDLYSGRLRIGAQAGTPGAAWIEDNLVKPKKMPASNLLLYPDMTALTGHLVNGTIDASIADSPAQAWAVSGRPLEIAGQIPTGGSYAVAVRKSDLQLQTMMDDGIRLLQADPYWDELMKKYGMEN